jgi:hypothetical protein
MVYKHAISTVVPSRPVKLPVVKSAVSGIPQDARYDVGNEGNFADDDY